MTGILDVSAEQYHADQIADHPTLSRSIAHILCTQSPAHAREAHPKLNPNYKEDDGDGKFDVGTIVHQLILGGEERIAVVEAKDWRTNDAKEQKHIARVQGQVPILAHQWNAVAEMAEVIKERIAAWPSDLLGEGDYEHTLVWEDAGVTCRARLDHLAAARTHITDLKTTSRSAAEWTLFNSGYDLQAFMYQRAVEVTLGMQPRFFFVVAEAFPPYEMRVIEPGPDVYALAARKFAYAAALWKQCLDTGVWPGYPQQVAVLELPPWIETRWLEKEAREEFAA